MHSVKETYLVFYFTTWVILIRTLQYLVQNVFAHNTSVTLDILCNLIFVYSC